MSNPNKPANPYGDAASAYGDNAQKHTPDQRELEARVLLKSARMIQDIKEAWEKNKKKPAELLDTLDYNRQIWMMFYDTALENPEGDRPNDLRSNIINLANFIFKRELEIISNPAKEKLDILITINREVAAGLMTNANVSSEIKDNQQSSDTKKSAKDNASSESTKSVNQSG